MKMGKIVLFFGLVFCSILSCQGNHNTQTISTIKSEKEVPTAQALAAKYKSLIGDALFYSEADLPWEPAFSTTKVEATFPIEQIKIALQSGDTPIEIYGNEEAIQLLDGFINDNPYDKAQAEQYRKFKEAISKDLGELRLIRVGVMDSGEIKVYILGRTKDGYLSGLKTISVET